MKWRASPSFRLMACSSSRSYEVSSPESTTASSPSMRNQANSKASLPAMQNQAISKASSPSMPSQSITTMPSSSTPNQAPSPNPTLQELLNVSRQSSTSASSCSPHPSLTASPRQGTRRTIVGIRILNGNADINPSKFLTGDIVQMVTGADNVSFSANFPNGKFSLLGELFNFHNSGINTLTIKVQRSECEFSRTALIVPGRDPPFVLADSDDATHVFIFEDYTEDTCLALQVQGHERIVERLSHLQVAACNVSYPWEENMERVQNAEGVGMLYSMVVGPHTYGVVKTPQFSNLEETVHQATTWLYASKGSGVPLLFHNIQTEPLLTEDLEQSSVSAYLPNILSTGSYGLRQSADRHVIRAVRIWFAFQCGEVKIELMARQGEALLGVTIGRTLEGFCYVTKVNENTAADRAGLKKCLEAAEALGMKLVVTRVGSERVIPWFILNGIIRCYDNSSISNYLSEHCHAGMPAYLHVVNVEGTTCPRTMATSLPRVESNASNCLEA